MKACLLGGQLARRYGLPYRSSNANAANTLDAQAAYESVFSLWGAVMGGVNLLMHGAGWMEGGDHGPAVVPKDLGKSPLIRSIRSHDPGTLMPPDDPLSPLEIALLQTWVLLGAPDPRP
jgi:hypothetical protein